jgi:hypothetical protein
MPLALEELGEKVADSIADATSMFRDFVAGHFTDPVPVRKQCAVLRVQEEKSLNDYEVVTMMDLFLADVTIVDTYNLNLWDGVREVFLAQRLQEVREAWAKENITS